MGYLKLSRREGERVFLGNAITVTVMQIKGNQVCLAFSAPKDIPIDREEIALRKGILLPREKQLKNFIFDSYFSSKDKI